MRYKIQDYGAIRETLHKFIKESKKSSKDNIHNYIAYIRFLKELRRDINDHLKQKGIK